MVTNLNPELLNDLLRKARTRDLVLPNFQRSFVWGIEDQRSLATSLLLDVPVGSLLFLTGTSSEFSCRPIAETKALSKEPFDCEFLLDGQQRLSSLYTVLSDPLESTDWADTIRGTYWNLRYRWALQLSRDDVTEDPFAFDTMDLKPLPTDPDLIRMHLVALRVNLKAPSETDWFHPAWKPEIPEGNARQLEIINAAADRNLVPLWRVAIDGDDKNALHVKVIKEIGRRRLAFLRAQVADKKGSPALWDALDLDRNKPIDPDLLDESLGTLRADWVHSLTQLLLGMVRTNLPVVTLPTTEVDRAIVIFESMNSGGTPLSTFDLLTARLAKKDTQQNLSEMLFELISAFSTPIGSELFGTTPPPDLLSWTPTAESVALAKDQPSAIFKASFLSVLTLLANNEKGNVLTTDMMRQSEILKLQPDEVDKYWKIAADAILRAWVFLQVRCGVRSEGDLRNKLLIVPLALLLRGENALSQRALLDRLEFWYWSSVLTSTYTERQNENAIEDLKLLLNWAATGSKSENPFIERRAGVLNEAKYSDKATLLREDESAGVSTDVGMYLLQYELSRFPYDILSASKRLYAWIPQQEDHHLVPLGTAKTILESTQELRNKASETAIGRLLNSPLNRSLISKASNRTIGAMNIDQYMQDVPQAARVCRGLPEITGDMIQDLKGEETIAVSIAKEIMRQRFDRFFDWIMEELDSLHY